MDKESSEQLSSAPKAPAADIRISAVVCTFNRRESLERTLESLENQTLSRDRYEVIVVDSASGDSTWAYVSELAAKRKNLIALREETAGLSRARNRGLRAANGAVVAFIDDDAEADPQWLSKIIEAFEAGGCSLGAVGGPVYPVWETGFPSWAPDELLSLYSIVDWGDKPRYLDGSVQWLVGTNIAFEKALLQSIGGFPVHLGRSGGNLISMEETQVCRRLERLGHPLYYSPDVIAHHHINNARLCRNWLAARQFYNGVSAALLEELEAEAAPGLARRSLFSFGYIRPIYHLKLIFQKRAGFFLLVCRFLRRAGFIYGRMLWAKRLSLEAVDD